MSEDRKNWRTKIADYMLIAGFTSLIWGGVAYVMEPRLEEFIMYVVNKNKGSSTRGDLAKSSGLEKSQVAREFGKMYKDFKETQQNILDFNKTWIPHLENEKKFYTIGFFFDIEEDKVKYKDFDGSILPVWHDVEGWYYMKEGYKFYK